MDHALTDPLIVIFFPVLRPPVYPSTVITSGNIENITPWALLAGAKYEYALRVVLLTVGPYPNLPNT